jgi:hypothetical protein
MAVKADWYVLPGESVAASGTVTHLGSCEIRVLQNRIILASTTSNNVEVINMKEINAATLVQRENGWEITLSYGRGSCTLRVGTNWDWANQLFYHIQCRL